MSAQQSWVPLGRLEQRRRDHLWRHMRQGVNTGLARFLGRALSIDRMVERALERDRLRAGGFSVPVSFAVAQLGDALLLNVPTAALERRLADWVRCGNSRVNVSDYFLGGGDWERFAHPFAASTVAAEARELAEHGLDYRATRVYADYLARLAAGRPVTRNRVKLDSRARVDGYFERFVALFESIREHGVVRLAAARGLAPALSCASGVRRGRTEFAEQELGIAIGPDGELFRLPGGQHRTAIAQVLQVPRLPVQVRLVHIHWVREAVRQRGGRGSDVLRNAIADLAPI